MSKSDKKTYATVSESDGVDYRTMSAAMTAAGFKMNHSSARNHVLRIMRKFAEEYSSALGHDLSDNELEVVARSAAFQGCVADYIGNI
jgi:hypothetical protein